MRIITYLFWIFIILIGVSFAVINSHMVVIHYYIDSVNVYLPLLLLIELVIGAVLGIIAMLPAYLKMKNTGRKSRQRIKSLEQELENIRTASIEGFQ